MDTKETKKDLHVSKSKPAYNSNPFTLSFAALGRFFNTNANWAIAIVAVAFFSSVLQVGGNLAQSLANGQSSSTHYSSSAASAPGTPMNGAVILAIVIVVFVTLLVAILAGTVVSTYLQGMFSYVALQSEKGKKVGFGEAFEAVTKRFWRLFTAQLLAGLKVFGWMLLFIVPGIIAALRYTLLSYVIMDEPENHGGALAAHARVKLLVKKRLIEVFGVNTVSGVIPIIGGLVGISGKAALYRQLQVYTDANLEKPKKHWLNYLGIFIFGGILCLLLTIGILVLLAAAASSK